MFYSNLKFVNPQTGEEEIFPIAVNRSGSGKPYSNTPGVAGMLYMDKENGDLYLCKNVNSDTGQCSWIRIWNDQWNEAEQDPTVFDWAKKEIFAKADLVDPAGHNSFIDIDGTEYYRYHASAQNFEWVNPCLAQGAVTVTFRAFGQYDNRKSSAMYAVYADGTEQIMPYIPEQTTTFVSDGSKALLKIRGSGDLGDWMLLDMSVMSVRVGYNKGLPAATADFPGGVKAEPATQTDTLPVRIGADGFLYTSPAGSGNASPVERTRGLIFPAEITGNAAVTISVPVALISLPFYGYTPGNGDMILTVDNCLYQITGFSVGEETEYNGKLIRTLSSGSSPNAPQISLNRFEGVGNSGVSISVTTIGTDGSFNQEQENIYDGNDGAPGATYIPKVTQIDADTVEFEFTPSPIDLGETRKFTVELPSGSGSSQNVELDTTLTVTGKAADAKAVGDAIKSVSNGAVVGRFFGKVANFLGDSQTDDEGNYKSVFFYDWLKDILGLSATNNYGYSGTTIMPISGQTRSFLERYPSMDDSADLIVVWGGTNDYHYGHALGEVDDTENTTFCGALNKLCKGLIAKYPQKDILFVTPTPRGNIAGAVATQKEYADAIIEVCAKYCIPVFDAFRKCNMPIVADTAYDSEGNIIRKYTVDGLHLNDLGHEILGKSMANFILYSEMAGAQTAWGENTVNPDEPDVPDEPDATLTSISATYSGGSVSVGTSLSELSGLTVTAMYSDNSTKTVTDYTLSGTIAEGENTITVSYGGKTATFVVVGVAESGGGEETNAPASPVDGKTVTFTAQASWPAASNLTMLVNADDIPDYVGKDILTIRMVISDATKTVSAFGKGMQTFTDETGELNNGKFKSGISEYVTSTMDGNVIVATAKMENTQPDFTYAKIPVSISASEYPVSFKIVSLTAELNGTYIPIQAVGGFYANEGYSES